MLIDFFITPVKPTVTPRLVVLMPITEADTDPVPYLPRDPAYRRTRMKRDQWAKLTKEQKAERRRAQRKLWMQRPDVSEYQKQKTRERQKRFAERHQERLQAEKRIRNAKRPSRGKQAKQSTVQAL